MSINLFVRGPRSEKIPVEVDVDIRSELERFEWTRLRYERDMLVAASPFRYERHPSFAVSLVHGGWNDMGANDENYRSGGLVKLLAFLDGVTPDEVVERLLTEYSSDYRAEVEAPRLNMTKLTTDKPAPITLDERMLSSYQFRHPYLEKRGISEGVQRLLGVGYDKRRNAIVLPWRHPNGKLAALKFRSTYSRVFWYEQGGTPIRELVYGADVIYSRQIKRSGLVEGEPDAMTLMTCGIPAMATGGATNWNAIKRDIIVRSPLEEIVLFRDNDAAGKAWARRILADLRPYITVKVAVVPGRYKDVNEAYTAGVSKVKFTSFVERAKVMKAALRMAL